jgi:hypothetical protein
MNQDPLNPLDLLPLLPDEEQYIRDRARAVSGSSTSRYAIAGAIAGLVADGIESRRRSERAMEEAA